MEKMRRITIAVMTCLIIITAGLFLGAHNAKAEGKAALQVTSVEGYAGDTVTVKVSVKDNPGMASLEFKVGFDNTVLEIVSVTADETVFKGPMVNDTANNFVGYVYADLKEGKGDTDVLTITFKILNTASVGDTALTVYDLDCSNFDGDTVPSEGVNGNVKVLCKHVTTSEVQTKAPTCTATGSKNIVCDDCSEVLDVVTINALGHRYGEYVTTTEPTCTKAGVATATCSTCGDKVTKEIAAIGHKYGEYVTTTEPTCTEAGVATAMCSVCGDKVTKEIAALGHKYGEYVTTTEPTCTEAGVATATCSECGETITKEVASLGHEIDEFLVSKEPTESEKGELKGTCKICGKEIKIAMPVIDKEAFIATDKDGKKFSGKAVVGKGLTLTFSGIGMNNNSPKAGDIRYVPTSWKMGATVSRDIETVWENAPYTADIKFETVGENKITVVYSREIYNGVAWIADGKTYIDEIVINVSEAPAEPESTEPETREYETVDKTEEVETGDSIGIYIVLLVMLCATCGTAVVFLVKKKTA